MKSSQKTPISLYIHWPYCLSKCPYCDFASTASSSVDEERLWTGYQRDLDRFLDNRSLSTVFLGGGTPSLMSPAFVEKIFSYIQKKTSFSDNIEITIEANPDAIDLKKMKDFHSLGINRLSLGVQSLTPQNLLFLGRRHTVQTALNRIKEAQSVFDRVNMDLIYALPHQSATDWERELKQALSIGLTHYSLYQLTIEDNTVFGKKGVTPASDDLATDLYCLTDEIMVVAGIPSYEVSNYAAPGQECRHNLAYWLGYDYIGIGPAAHGRIGLTATQNPRTVSGWLEKGTRVETLTPQERKTEKLLMGLRLRQHWFPTDDLNQKNISKLVNRGLLEQSGQGIRPTLNGVLVLDQIVLDLMD